MPETERQQTERILRDLLAKASAEQDDAEVSRDSLLSGLFSKTGKDGASKDSGRLRRSASAAAKDWPVPPKAQFPKPSPKADRRSDIVVAALGIALGLICALFPWYIFFNQEQFGVQAIKFGGRGSNAGWSSVDLRPGGGAEPLSVRDVPTIALDMFPTGTPAASPEDPSDAPGIDQQPFPAASFYFHLVHVANGRAMIEDDTGLWIVQHGSMLPDSSHVSSIEQRGGEWVLVTSTDRVLEQVK
jgi:hypothetical protein